MSRTSAIRRGARPIVLTGAAWTAAASGYLLGLAVVAALPERRPGAIAAGPATRIVVLIPAHDEEAGITPAIAALARQRYPAEAYEVIVIADNCGDRTAAVAAGAGATVWEREAPDARGKGQALAWALDRLWRERPATEAVAVIDADCLASPGLLAAVDERLQAGAQAVQAVYDVANPAASPTAALRWAGFALMHRVRARGQSRLGLSCGLFGTGMAFTRSLLLAHPWSSFSVTEDAEYHVRLLEAGERVEFIGDEHVDSPMPTTYAGSADQQMRWEAGNTRLLVETAPRLLVAGLRDRDPERVHAALEQLVPPQTVLSTANLALVAAATALRERRARRLASTALFAHVAYVLIGLRVAHAPPVVYRALSSAPRLVAAKLPLFARIAAGRGETRWVRTEREPAPVAMAREKPENPRNRPRPPVS